MATFKTIQRRISISEVVAKKDDLYTGLLADKSWDHANEVFYKNIPCPAFVEIEHENFGPPEVGTPSADQVIEMIRFALAKGLLSPTKLLQDTNNGMYLSANAAAKPKKPSTAGAAKAEVEALLNEFTEACILQPALFASWKEAKATGEKMVSFARQWKASGE